MKFFQNGYSIEEFPGLIDDETGIITYKGWVFGGAVKNLYRALLFVIFQT